MVGAYLDDDNGSGSGSAYVYRWNGTDYDEIKLTATDGANQDNFGVSVAVSGDTVVVGAYDDNDNGSDSGSAYAYRWNGTDYDEIKLIASDGAADDDFGYSVGVDGDTVVVGARNDDDKGSNSGSAYVYRWNGTSYDEIKLTASDGEADDNFGYSVAVYGNSVVVGAYSNDDDGWNSGSTYVYRWNGVNYDEIKVTASDAAENDRFGKAVAIDGDTIVSGNSGSVYVYDLNDLDPSIIAMPDGSTKITASDGLTGDNFGNSVAVDGDTIVVGADGDDDNGSGSGSAYVYRWNGTSYDEIKLTASDGEYLDCFGQSVAADDDTVVVGAWNDDDNGDGSGSAYIYRWNDTTTSYGETKLTATDGENGDYFGLSVAVDGDTVVVGAYRDDDNGDNSGSTYIYRWNGTSYDEIKLSASDGEANDSFGRSVAADGDTVVVGAFQDDDNGSNSGSAYVYRWNGTSYDEIKLTASDGARNDYFGFSIAVDGDTVVVGAYDDDDNGYSSGSAYVYRWNGASYEETKLTASDGTEYDYFGASVAVYGDTVVVGAWGDDDNGDDSGSAYLYCWNGASYEETKLTAFDAATYDYYGGSVAVNGDKIVVGARRSDGDNGSRSGSAYVYDLRDFLPSITILPDNSTKITASDGAAYDAFGYSVSIDAGNIAVGAKNDDDGGTQSGSAYIYRWSGTKYDEIKLTASDGVAYDYYGATIAIDGDNVVVGAYQNDGNGNNSGSAYLYHWNGVDYDETKLIASDGVAQGQFGVSVAIDGDIVVIGANQDDDNGDASGSTYVYRWNGVNYDESKLIASDGESDDLFGTAVAVDGDTIAVGAWGDDDNGSTSGSAYVYRWNGASYDEIKLTASDGAEYDNFGYSIAVDGDTIVVGASQDDDNGDDSGSAYVYRWNGTDYDEFKLTASDGLEYDFFGESVAVDGDNILVGAQDSSDSSSGRVYIYRWNGTGYDEKATLAAYDSEAYNSFGRSISIDGDTIVAGSTGDDDNGNGAGSAYVYDLNDIEMTAPSVPDNNDDNWQDLGDDTVYKLAVNGSGNGFLKDKSGLSGDWVGLGDSTDYRKLDLTHSGLYDFTITGLDGDNLESMVRLTIHEAYDYRGGQRLRRLKAINVRPRYDRDGNIIRGGEGSIDELLLDGSKDYYLQVEAPYHARAYNTGYTVTVDGTAFGDGSGSYGNNADDKWKSLTSVYELAIDNNGDGSIVAEWVGFGDEVDYRKLDLTYSGSYNFDISGLTSAVRMTVYEKYDYRDTGRLRRLKTINVRPRYDRLGNIISGSEGSIDDLLLYETKEYYLQVEAPYHARAYNTGYNVTIDGTAFGDGSGSYGNNADDDWESLAGSYDLVIDDDGDGSIVAEWVGFGDVVDYRKLDLIHSGSYKFKISGLSNTTTMGVYELDRGRLRRLESIRVRGTGTDTAYTGELLLDNSKDYYLKVEAPLHARAENSRYWIDVTGEVFNNPTNNLENDQWTDNDVDADVINFSNNTITGEWVGFGDAVDYRKVKFTHPGSYNFEISGLTSRVRMTIYEKYDYRGNDRLRRLKTISVNPRYDRENNLIAGTDSGSIDDLLLDKGNSYYLQVEAPYHTRGDNTSYDITVTGEEFNLAYNGDNEWNDLGVAMIGLDDPVINEWVGFGDANDYFKVDIDNLSGSYGFDISGITNTVRVTGYERVANRLKRIKSFTLRGSSGGGSTDGWVLDGTKEYYLQVEAPHHARGQNTNYDLYMNGYQADNSNDNWGDPGIQDLDTITTFVDEWVALGDATDWFNVDIASTGIYRFDLDLEVSRYANMKLYEINEDDTRGDELDLDANNERYLATGNYALEISSADNGRGRRNTGYDLGLELLFG